MSQRNVRAPLTFALCLLHFACSSAFSQGILPAKSPPPEDAAPKLPYLLIGQAVPKTLTVVDPSGTPRPLLSYKTATDILVIGFYDPACSYNQAVWHDLKLLFDAFRDWHVSFIAISENPDTTGLTQAMQQAKLTYPVTKDLDQQAAKKLRVTAFPEIVVLDEGGILRYRGPLHDAMQTPGTPVRDAYARNAIESVVGHTEAVPLSEPTRFIGCPLPQ